MDNLSLGKQLLSRLVKQNLPEHHSPQLKRERRMMVALLILLRSF